VFNIGNKNVYEIQRHDDDPDETFKTDQDAFNHVEMLAIEVRSRLHIKALKITNYLIKIKKD